MYNWGEGLWGDGIWGDFGHEKEQVAAHPPNIRKNSPVRVLLNRPRPAATVTLPRRSNVTVSRS